MRHFDGRRTWKGGFRPFMCYSPRISCPMFLCLSTPHCSLFRLSHSISTLNASVSLFHLFQAAMSQFSFQQAFFYFSRLFPCFPARFGSLQLFFCLFFPCLPPIWALFSCFSPCMTLFSRIFFAVFRLFLFLFRFFRVYGLCSDP